MSKPNKGTRIVSVRVPVNVFSRLEELSQVTGLTNTELAREAIAQYCGVNVQTVGDRLAELEREVAALHRKFKVLGS
jgi:predicted transcriptional regulator